MRGDLRRRDPFFLIACFSRCNGLAYRPSGCIGNLLFGALDGRPHLAASPGYTPLRWIPVSFATVPSRIWMPGNAFALFVLVSVRKSRRFPRRLSQEWDSPTQQYNTPYPDIPVPEPAPDRTPPSGYSSASPPEAVITSLRFSQVSDHREDASTQKHLWRTVKRSTQRSCVGPPATASPDKT